MAGFEIGTVTPDNINTGSNSVIKIMQGTVLVWSNCTLKKFFIGVTPDFPPDVCDTTVFEDAWHDGTLKFPVNGDTVYSACNGSGGELHHGNISRSFSFGGIQYGLIDIVTGVVSGAGLCPL